MDSAMNNSLIATKIFRLLSHQDQMACRLVSPTWKKNMDQPSFWIKKCDHLGQTQELHDAWYDLLRRIKETEEENYLQQELVECLMKWYGKFESIISDGSMVSVGAIGSIGSIISLGSHSFDGSIGSMGSIGPLDSIGSFESVDLSTPMSSFSSS